MDKRDFMIQFVLVGRGADRYASTSERDGGTVGEAERAWNEIVKRTAKKTSEGQSSAKNRCVSCLGKCFYLCDKSGRVLT